MIVFLFIMMLLDYCLTKYGIYLGFVTEGNFLMKWLMVMPFCLGLPIKIIISTMLCIPLELSRKHGDRIYKYAMVIAYIVYTFVFACHLYWIFAYRGIL
jgi:ABC-type sugar transport system permease subunit